MYLLYHHIKKKHIFIFLLTTILWISLILLENFIHYNVAKNGDNKNFIVLFPSSREWVKIIVIITIFLFLRGIIEHFVH